MPVYISRFGGLPDGYGAFIAWEKGESATWVRKSGERVAVTIVDPRMKTHPASPVIDTALGRGRYVIEVELEGTIKAVSARQLQIRPREA